MGVKVFEKNVGGVENSIIEIDEKWVQLQVVVKVIGKNGRKTCVQWVKQLSKKWFENE